MMTGSEAITWEQIQVVEKIMDNHSDTVPTLDLSGCCCFVYGSWKESESIQVWVGFVPRMKYEQKTFVEVSLRCTQRWKPSSGLWSV